MVGTIVSFVNEGLGHSSHLVDLGDGTALVIDPARLPTAQLAHAAEHGPVALFSGGSLTVGTVGRTDLLGDEHREALARDLHRALRDRILTLPDDLPVYPTHGAGSFCSAPGGGDRTTTIGRERATNPLLSMAEDDFVAHLLAGLGTFPDYFRRLPSVNQRGLPVHGHVPTLARLDVEALDRLLAEGAVVVDARPVAAFAAGHIPGSLSIALRPVFASWLGWLADADQPVVVVLEADQDEADLVRQALTIGHDNLAGRLTGGIGAWAGAGRPVATTALIEPTTIDRTVIDVRQAAEYAAGHAPGAANIELGALPDAPVTDGPVATMCGKTERAMTAASVLERRGHADVAVVRGGYTAWTAHHPASATR